MDELLPDTACPQGWSIHDDVCLQVQETSLSYDDAQAKGCAQGYFYSHKYLGYFIQVSGLMLPRCPETSILNTVRS